MLLKNGVNKMVNFVLHKFYHTHRKLSFKPSECVICFPVKILPEH